jgi:tRNA pseudouridine55 synthase
MARKRKGDPVHGWIIIDKPLGLTSSKVVGIVRKSLNAQKAGHGGTLDPLATGILPIALGEATKTVSYAMEGTKTYRFTICFGEARTTDDREGEVSETSDVRPTFEQIEAVLGQFTGEISQVPPIFSAIKVDGKRSYDLARADEAVELKSRIITVHSITLCQMPDADHAVLEVVAGKGTYVRSLARDIAQILGTVGYVSELRRTAVGPFSEKDAISLDSLETLGHSAPPGEKVLPIETVLDDIPALALTEQEARRLRHGQAIDALPVATRTPLSDFNLDEIVCAMEGGRLVALVKVTGGEIRPVRVMNLVDE